GDSSGDGEAESESEQRGRDHREDSGRDESADEEEQRRGDSDEDVAENSAVAHPGGEIVASRVNDLRRVREIGLIRTTGKRWRDLAGDGHNEEAQAGGGKVEQAVLAEVPAEDSQRGGRDQRPRDLEAPRKSAGHDCFERVHRSAPSRRSETVRSVAQAVAIRSIWSSVRYGARARRVPVVRR